MKCNCQENFYISSKASKIHFIVLVPELLNKTKLNLTNLNLNPKLEDNICTFEHDNPNKFFNMYNKLLCEIFNDMEQKAITIFVENDIDKLTINSVLKAKSLDLYLNFINDNSFFEILNNQSFTSHFQTIIDINNKEIYGYEALIRGVMPDGKLIFPDEIFEKSERNNTNFKLDQICRETALKTAAVKRINKKLFINFLPTSIYDPEFCLQSTVKWANQLEFDPKNIVFEVVETEKVKDKEHLKMILNFYRSRGFKIALDDVGEGYSSLNMIVDIKPDILKIDRNIIMNIESDSMKQSIYKALRQIAIENDITLLAEGVETQEELDTIKEFGVDLVQGYYYSKPSSEPIRKLQI